MDINYVEIFKALSDESRLKIVKSLIKNESQCACKLLELVSCGQPTLSHHMTILIKCGLINSKKVGKWVHYSINNDVMLQIIKYLGEENEL